MNARLVSFLLILPLTAAAAPDTPKSVEARVGVYVTEANREAWGIVDPATIVTLSAPLAALQYAIGDSAGVRDSLVRVNASLKKLTETAQLAQSQALMARLHACAGDKPASEEWSQKAVPSIAKLDPPNRAVPLLDLIGAKLINGDGPAATALMEQFHTAAANRTQELARAAGLSKQSALVAPTLQKWLNDSIAAAPDPRAKDAQRLRAVSLLCDAELISLAEQYATAIESSGDRATAWTALMVIALRDQRNADADRLLDLAQKSIEALPAALRSTAWSRLSIALSHHGRKSQAGEIAQKAGESAAASLDPISAGAAAADAFREADQLGRAQEALKKCSLAAESAAEEDRPEAWAQIAMARARADQIELAKAALASCEGSPGVSSHEAARAQIAIAIARSGKAEPARQFAKTIPSQRTREAALAQVAGVLGSLGMYDEALGVLSGITDGQARAAGITQMVRQAALKRPPEELMGLLKQLGTSQDRCSLYIRAASAIWKQHRDGQLEE